MKTTPQKSRTGKLLMVGYIPVMPNGQAGSRIVGRNKLWAHMTAGMAVKAALEHITAQADAPRPNDPKYWEHVWEYASDVVRIARMIEAGKLAKPVKDRASEAGEDVPY